MKLFRCFKPFHGQSSSQPISGSPERITQTETPISTALFNSPGSPTSRMLDFSTLLTPDGQPLFTQIFRQPKTPMPSRITSPKRVTIVNPDSTRFLGEPKPIRTMSITTPSMQEVFQRLLTLSKPEIQNHTSSNTITSALT
ncbi:AC4 protein [Tomato chlorotic leaf curl virus]|uniref:AC4 protein n=1 Tax=Tomato chlorotic leaf curl virus TaxID=2015441 RepID=A0A4D6FVJ3_9GEMI|nr:AC4 protein [Tomato chlorotic leaf curl virus]QCB65755.1 AC4 protein [Tomato chlorotic leaf curl virus]QCB65762.1 AC4 protein [Tomato chlorotic leaf curl virus]